MGMPITIQIAERARDGLLKDLFAYFDEIDKRFSPFRPDSEVSALNQGRLSPDRHSAEMRDVLALAARTKGESNGFFDIRRPDGLIDPCGIVKGWAIRNAANILKAEGIRNFYLDAGGDIQTGGRTAEGQEWVIGIRNPFNDQEIIKAIWPRGRGVATSGTYVRGQHIYDPHRPDALIDDIVSLTVIGPDVLEADRFATAAFAMGKAGIFFLEEREGLEAYLVDARGIATQTRGFGAFVVR
jgi:thiamine biosynthesis lipoprotein